MILTQTLNPISSPSQDTRLINTMRININIYSKIQWPSRHSTYQSSPHLDWEADDDEKEVSRGEARQEGVGGRLEGGLPHHRQDDQDVAAHSEAERKAANIHKYYFI